VSGAAAKQRLRAWIRGQPRPPAEVADGCAHAVAAIARQHARVRSARRIVLFAALRDEIPTQPLFEALRGQGRECLFPRSASQGLDFALVANWHDLIPGPLGALEPAPQLRAVRLGREDLVFAPGLAFDAHGGRLGRGGGYYDRVLAECGHAVPFLCGLAYASRLIEQVPMEPLDVRVDAFLSESGWLDAAGEVGA